jgi:hypothetical protein
VQVPRSLNPSDLGSFCKRNQDLPGLTIKPTTEKSGHGKLFREMRLMDPIPGAIAYEIPGHTRGLGRQILPHEILLSRTQIGLTPNLEYMHPNYRIISLL